MVDERFLAYHVYYGRIMRRAVVLILVAITGAACSATVKWKRVAPTPK